VLQQPPGVAPSLNLRSSSASALTRLSGLTPLHGDVDNGKQCGSLRQLTGLRELQLGVLKKVSAAALRQLAALEQLTSLGIGKPQGTPALRGADVR